MGKKQRKVTFQWIPAIVAGLLIIVACFYMQIDTKLTGDEVVTYGMANSSNGWMLSAGRAQAYFQNEILDDSISATLGNVWDCLMDVVHNKGQAAYFSYPRLSETGWYDAETVNGWFEVDSSDRFTFGRVYLNAMGDNSNSWLYYMLVHLVSSIAPAISATKWSAFLVNLFAALVSAWLIDKTAVFYSDSKVTGWLAVLIWICSINFIQMVTNLRPYMLEMMFCILLLYLHLQLLETYRNGEAKDVRYKLLLLLVTYPFAYVARYTMGLWAVSLGICTIIWLKRENNEENRAGKAIRQYILYGFCAIVLGILIDPISAMGLFDKFLDKGNSGLTAMFTSTVEELIVNVSGHWILMVLFIMMAVTAFHSALSRIWELLGGGYCFTAYLLDLGQVKRPILKRVFRSFRLWLPC